MAGTPKAANEALAALIAAGIELADFSMGSPSLEEVFFALTGGSRGKPEREEDDGMTDTGSAALAPPAQDGRAPAGALGASPTRSSSAGARC